MILYDIPESMTEQSLASLTNINNVIQGARAKSFKIVKDENGKRKLIVYLESWDALNLLLGSHVVWDDSKLDWCRHSSVSKRRTWQRTKKASNDKANKVIKDQNGSRERLTGTNTIPLGSRRQSSSTKFAKKQENTNPDLQKSQRIRRGKGNKSPSFNANVQELLLKLISLL